MDYPRRVVGGTLTGYHGDTPGATLKVVELDRATRTKRALLGIAAWWAAAASAVFIPVAHFALVPGFLGFGVYSAVRRLRTASVTLGVHGTCPDCDTEQDFEVSERWTEREALACGTCRRSLRFRSD